MIFVIIKWEHNTGCSITKHLLVLNYRQTVKDIPGRHSQADVAVLDFSKVDFSKGFDKVSHGKLIMKLKYCNLHPDAFGWIGAFLADRTTVVHNLAILIPLLKKTNPGNPTIFVLIRGNFESRRKKKGLSNSWSQYFF